MWLKKHFLHWSNKIFLFKFVIFENLDKFFCKIQKFASIAIMQLFWYEKLEKKIFLFFCAKNVHETIFGMSTTELEGIAQVQESIEQIYSINFYQSIYLKQVCKFILAERNYFLLPRIKNQLCILLVYNYLTLPLIT